MRIRITNLLERLFGEERRRTNAAQGDLQRARLRSCRANRTNGPIKRHRTPIPVFEQRPNLTMSLSRSSFFDSEYTHNQSSN
jgi:hypothetical protein